MMKEILIAFSVCLPLLIIGIIKFIKIFSFKKSNLESTTAAIKRTDYDFVRTSAQTTYSYSYKKTGTYTFDYNGKEYELTYSSDRDHGYLPDTITACFPKGRPQDAFAEGNTPFVKLFFNAALFTFIYFAASTSLSVILMMFTEI